MPDSETPLGRKGGFTPFAWDDALRLDDQVSDDERAIRDAAHAYCQGKLFPRVLQANRHERFDREIMNEFGAMGFLGATLEGYGCAGINYVAYGLIAREVERVDSGYRSAFSVQSSLVMYPIHAFGSDAQKEKYLPRLRSGELVGCFGLTEPDGGSDPGAMRTRARSVAGGYVLNGSKTWITNSPIAFDVFVVWAKDTMRAISVASSWKRVCRAWPRPRSKASFPSAPARPGMIMMQDVLGCPAENMLPKVKELAGAVQLPEQRCAMASHGAPPGPPSSAGTRRCSYTLELQGLRPPACRHPVDPEEAGRHADRDHHRAASRSASWPAARRGQGGAGDDLAGQQQLSAARPLDIARTARDMHGGNGIVDEYHVIRHVIEPRDGQHLRGNPRRARPDSRTSTDRTECVRKTAAYFNQARA